MASIDSLDDGNIIQTISFLGIHDLPSTALVFKRFRELSGHDIIWRPICETHWTKFFRADEWLKEASERESAAREVSSYGVWTREFIDKESLRYLTLGIFAMGAHLQIGAKKEN